MNQRELFLRHVGQTSEEPLAIQIDKAEGVYLYGPEEQMYIDLIGGISVANTGHRHPAVITAIQQQLDAYLHIMVYGELVTSPQVRYAQKLTSLLPEKLNNVFYTNSGAEAVDGAMKLAKRYTGRTKIIAFNKAYHGSTQGPLSIIGDESFRNAYRPLLPDVFHEEYNSYAMLDTIDTRTACVIVEPAQAERGVILPDVVWFKALREKCTATGTLLILDEIQSGFGRTGSLWAFEQLEIVPDILLLGKALGGGMPMGAFIADKKVMNVLTHNPILGHMSTFGGHPVCCAAGLAALEVLLQENLIEQVNKKAALFKALLQHESIVSVNATGLLMAVHFDSFETNKAIIDKIIEKGAFTDWFLFAANALRICPPLTIKEEEIRKACSIILAAIQEVAA